MHDIATDIKSKFGTVRPDDRGSDFATKHFDILIEIDQGIVVPPTQSMMDKPESSNTAGKLT
jgi:hypothetical protein